MKLTIPFTGHEQVLSLHEKTLEITKDDNLTPQGDCIIGVNSDISCLDLPEKMKKKIQNSESKISFTLQVGKFRFKIQGHGSEKLTLKHVSDIVLRKSAFTCSRTIAINCDKASSDIPRDLVRLLQNPQTKGKMIIEVL
ncbi:MAG: DUF371 domain-containing protein [Crenarchaeota archaeon]|nr:DUF371 domain-containing protein [Thermoproteota archaeon]MDA1125129.1 DUF371 domain-containing protein [Thermoproteota archaeon]